MFLAIQLDTIRIGGTDNQICRSERSTVQYNRTEYSWTEYKPQNSTRDLELMVREAT